MEKACPQATLILDLYHAMEPIGQAGKASLADEQHYVNLKCRYCIGRHFWFFKYLIITI